MPSSSQPPLTFLFRLRSALLVSRRTRAVARERWTRGQTCRVTRPAANSQMMPRPLTTSAWYRLCTDSMAAVEWCQPDPLPIGKAGADVTGPLERSSPTTGRKLVLGRSRLRLVSVEGGAAPADQMRRGVRSLTGSSGGESEFGLLGDQHRVRDGPAESCT